MARRIVKSDVVSTEPVPVKEVKSRKKKGVVVPEATGVLTPLQELGFKVKEYFFKNSESKVIAKKVKELNTNIKDLMFDLHIAEFDTDDIHVSISNVESESYDDDVLLAIVKDMGRKDLILTKEYVNMTELESAIYRKEFDAAVLAPSLVLSNSIRLNVNKVKPTKIPSNK